MHNDGRATVPDIINRQISWLQGRMRNASNQLFDHEFQTLLLAFAAAPALADLHVNFHHQMSIQGKSLVTSHPKTSTKQIPSPYRCLSAQMPLPIILQKFRGSHVVFWCSST